MRTISHLNIFTEQQAWLKHIFFFVFNEQYWYFYHLKNASLIHTAVVCLYFPKILSTLGFPFSIHNYSKHSCNSGQNFKGSTTRQHP